jgi:hypothetical protein
MTNEEAAAICRALGHNPRGVLARPEVNKYRFDCSCGYQSTNRQTFALAIEAGIHHMRKEAQHAVANGYAPGLKVVS